MAAAGTGSGFVFVRNVCGLFRDSRLAVLARPQQLSWFHSSSSLSTKNWEKKNLKVFPPQLPEEARRPAVSESGGELLEEELHFCFITAVCFCLQEVHHCRRQIKYSKDKMWYLAKMIRGMSIDEAVAQLEFNDKKGAKIMKEVLLEAQEMAVKTHNVEYKSNLHVAESFSSKGKYLKRIRYHGRGMFGIMDKVYCHYFVKLVEGPPPRPEQKTGLDQAREYVQKLKDRTVIHSL
ncbi:39S ribosomal protein L22, mitochondrial [Oryzias melastigma]|uniref:Large ribosomal subunit protein uL22m n=1 Tax=Oryzias melastigma TaxID=30732 RepID=A0A834FW02_ORYME|nr:39S ribosomal protein L22, mitochondrial [Oryzias melastigma]